MYDEHGGPIDSLVHLWIDGAFSRRELVKRVAKHTGSIAAAMTTLNAYEAFGQTPSACPADVKVPADVPDLITQDVVYPSEDSSVMGYLAYPKAGPPKMPAVIVIHENRGLVEHIRIFVVDRCDD